MTTIFKRRVLAPAMLGLCIAAPMSAQAEFSGNVSVVSKYVLRGITAATENSGAAVQGGFDYAHNSGFYAGYWGSSLGYPGADSTPTTDAEFENDFYLGWAPSFGEVGLDVGLIYYWYMDTEDASGAELSLGASYGPFSAGIKYLLQDVTWGNQGDTYLTFGYETGLPKDFTLGVTVGYYLYEDEGDFIASSENDSAVRHVDVSLSHPIGDTGADMSLTYVLGGEDRDENEQENTIVLGVSYGFDI